jgi:hypothetical protein
VMCVSMTTLPSLLRSTLADDEVPGINVVPKNSSRLESIVHRSN